MVAAWQPGKPVIVYGHSMGGLIASLYLIDHQDDFKAGILSAAAAKVPDNINGFTIAVAKLLSKIAPRSGMIGLDTNYLSHDKAVVNAYNTDPLVSMARCRYACQRKCCAP